MVVELLRKNQPMGSTWIHILSPPSIENHLAVTELSLLDTNLGPMMPESLAPSDPNQQT
jgi:hypothetical protein